MSKKYSLLVSIVLLLSIAAISSAVSITWSNGGGDGGLVNILANKELVPEFMPYFGSINPIVEAIELLLEDNDKLVQTSGELIRLAEPLTEKKACREVAEIVVEMLR